MATNKFKDKTEYCSQCGLCENDFEEELTEICPRKDKPSPESSYTGKYEDILFTKGSLKGSYSGTVPSVLKAALEEGLIDGVLGIGKGKDILKGEPIYISNSENIEEITGMRHTVSSLFSDLEKVPKDKKIALTGLPCHIEASSILEKRGYNVDYKIGIACGTNYDHSKFSRLLENNGIEKDKIKEYKLRETKQFTPYFKFKMDDGREKKLSVSKTIKCIPKGCRYCKDYLGYNSDISFGVLGAPKEHSISFIRNNKGMDLIKNAEEKGYLEVSEAPEGFLSDMKKYMYLLMPASLYMMIAFKTSHYIGAELMARYKINRLTEKIDLEKPES